MAETVDRFISTRRVGDAEITIWYETSGTGMPQLNVPVEMLYAAFPEIKTAGEVEVAVTTTIVRIGDAIIVIDPAFDDPESRLDQAMSSRVSDWTRSPGLQACLASLGVENAQVTHVIITHAHFDHCLGVTIELDGAYVPRFPNARYFLGSGDWRQRPEPGSEPPSREQSRYEHFQHIEMWPRLQAIEDAGLLELVDESLTIAPGLEILHAPGETPGHCVVRVSSAGEVFYHLGDLVHGWFEFEHPGWIIVDSLERDLDTMTATRLRLMPQVVGDDAVAFFGHAPLPGWGRLVEHESGYRWETL